MHEEMHMTHNDFHTDNFIIGIDNNVTILDFSGTVVMPESGFIEQNDQALLFTPFNGAPERVLDQGFSFNSDVWALACWMSQMANPKRLSAFQLDDELMYFAGEDYATDDTLTEFYDQTISHYNDCMLN
jgi:serine/threonine protein kinase